MLNESRHAKLAFSLGKINVNVSFVNKINGLFERQT